MSRYSVPPPTRGRAQGSFVAMSKFKLWPCTSSSTRRPLKVPPTLYKTMDASDPYIMSVSAVELATTFRFFIGGRIAFLLGGVDGRDLSSSSSSASVQRCKQTMSSGACSGRNCGVPRGTTMLRIGRRSMGSFDAAIKLLK
jgi:hypothetical protein